MLSFLYFCLMLYLKKSHVSNQIWNGLKVNEWEKVSGLNTQSSLFLNCWFSFPTKKNTVERKKTSSVLDRTCSLSVNVLSSPTDIFYSTSQTYVSKMCTPPPLQGLERDTHTANCWPPSPQGPPRKSGEGSPVPKSRKSQLCSSPFPPYVSVSVSLGTQK